MAAAPSPSLVRAALGEVGSLARLAAPLVGGLVLATAITLVDTAMLGPLGAVPLAAVSLTASVVIIFYAALYGFAGPVGLFAGRHHGGGTLAGIGRVARHGALLGVVGGIGAALVMAAGLLVLPMAGQPPEVIAVIAPYWLCLSAMLVPFTLTLVAKQLLDSTDRPWLSVLFTLPTVAINVALNWVLIYGHLGFPALGLTGAGIASLAASCIGTAILWLYVRHGPSQRAWWDDRGLARGDLRQQLREGLPMMTQYALEGGAVAVAGFLVGYFGAVALAGNQIAMSVGTTVYMLPLGMAAAVTIRVAQAAGAGNNGRIAAIGLAGIGTVTLWTALFALLFLLEGARIAGLFVDDPAVIAAAAAIFFVFGLTQVIDGIQSVSLGALRGMLDNRWPTLVSIVAYWLLALPLAWLLGFVLDLGAPGIWGGFGIGLIVAAVALSHRFARRSLALAG
ncbi:MAG: MATE family efflux transporter [Geminicoccaceae bacterium]